MKRLITLLFLLFTVSTYAQYNNEWIDFTKTYYKFKVGVTGLYRIPASTLATAGLGDTPAEQFKLIRNGVEVPLYTTEATGPLLANGYIEFWGEANDGKVDKALYREPSYQHTDKLSLQTDTAMYFLTISSTANLRLVPEANDVTSALTLPEPYFMHTVGTYYRNKINAGYAKYAGEYVYSSSYDYGEYYSSGDIGRGVSLVANMQNLAVYTGGPNAVFKFGASGNAPTNKRDRLFSVRINNSVILSDSINEFDDRRPSPIEIATSLISNGTATIDLKNNSTVATDRMVVSFYELTYPRKFHFGNTKNFAFQLPAKNETYNLAITNFVRGSAVPVLYDLTYGKRYTAVYSTVGDTLKFLLPSGTSQRRLVLVNQEASNVTLVNGLTPKTFTDFNTTANQGDYIIISNPILYTGTNGANPVAEYRDYRRSAEGGGYNAFVVDINELVDQFAFGIKQHPLSVKNFMRYAREKFVVAPKNLFLIGRGMDYVNYRNNESKAGVDRLNLITSYGYPASDNFLSSLDSKSAVPITPIGRLSVVHGYEIEDYLKKVKDYEHTQQTAPNTIKDRLWMKNVMHVTGASQSELGVTLCNFMHGFKNILEDTFSGAKVHMFCKSSANPVEQLSNDKVANLFHEGLSLMTYFGHSSSTTLEFNIDNPENYNNQGKYPVFSVNGCNAGNFFTYYPQRLNQMETLSERFVLAKERGSIAFFASTHYGIVSFLSIYVNELYKNMSKQLYGSGLGQMNQTTLRRLLEITTTTVNNVPVEEFYARCHSEEITLHGDPALKMNFQEKPDYVIEDPYVKISPTVVSIADNEFTFSAKLFNIGKAVNDSIRLLIKRQYPDGSVDTLSIKRIPGILHSDSIELSVPVIATRDKGVNKITITIDADNDVDEMSESNNTIEREVFIYEDEARPSFPYNNSIVFNRSQKMYASTANPFSIAQAYVFQMDTTEQFNSAVLVNKELTASGGIIEIDPGVQFTNNTVYYWRTSLKPSDGGTFRWNNSSFIFIEGSSDGFNQSHYYQHQKSSVNNISINTNRKWEYGRTINNLFIRNNIYPTGGAQDEDFSVTVNSNSDMITSACVGTSLIFNVFDGVTFKPWKNVDANGNNLFLSGSGSANCRPTRNYNFEFSHTSIQKRRLMSRFMDSIPDGSFVVVRTIDYSNASNAPVWKSDENSNGAGNSLYHRLVAAGFTTLDQYSFARSFILVYKKGDPSFTPKYAMTEGVYDKITVSADCSTPDTLGYITSPVFGAAKSWGNLHWKGKSEEQNSSDHPVIDVIGIGTNGTQEVLFTVDKHVQDLDISSIDANVYPKLQLKMRNVDSLTLTPYQLDYWRVNYVPVAEGAIAPNLLFSTKDSLDVGEILDFSVAFKNIGHTPFDSVRVKFNIIDKDNITHVLPFTKVKPLSTGDTVALRYKIDTKDFVGHNILSVVFNPDNDQPEQYSFNNFLYRDFHVKGDDINPLLDVTFDGVHILNNDIVSSRPHIQIKVKDEAKFMLLNDTSLVTDLKVVYPDMNNTVRTYKFNTDTLRFIPAEDGSDNTALIEFLPHFPTILDGNGEPLNPGGDEYRLIVRARDKSGNKAGSTEYNVAFKVIDKPMISNLLNYPNPFTTSTAFVFTLTGSEIPQNLKIQILTVTGKVVREITKEELGPIHIGRNITEFKWNGTDQYGQRLANGVYLYRVVTTLNNKRMEKYRAEHDNTDKYFNKGYGKMYLMR